MTPSDDFWKELSRIEPRYGDLFWDGTIEVGESPGWCEELARLIRAAQQPATPEELASEEATVAAMVEARRTARVHLERSPAQSGGGDPAVLLVERMTAQAALDAVVADLTSDQAEAVLLRVIAGFDVGETARIMRRSPGSVRVLCHRALRQLAMSLTQEMGAE